MVYTPSKQPILVRIDGDDVSDYFFLLPQNERNLPGITIFQEIGKAYDQLIISLANAESLDIRAWQEIVVSNPAETVRYFGGYLLMLNENIFSIGIDQVWTAVDYTVDMEKSVVNGIWEDKTDLEILADIRTMCEPDLTAYDFSTHVTSVGSQKKFRVPRFTVRQALDELANRVGADWYIDYDKNLHWFTVEDVLADFSLSDDPDYEDSFPYQDLRRTSDAVTVINRITVVGGNYLSDDVTHVYAGDGQQVRFVVPHAYHRQEAETGVIVEVNTGTDASPVWTSKTVGVKYIDDDGGFDVLFAFAEKYFEFTSAPPNLKSAWRVKARYEAPLRMRVRSQDSYQQYGRWFDGVVENRLIEDKETARLYGRSQLAKNALEQVAFMLSTDKPGLRAGMAVPLINALYGINGAYLIQRLTRTFVGGGWVRDSIEVGDYIPDLYAMILELGRKTSRQEEYREDEVLDELLDYYEYIPLQPTKVFYLLESSTSLAASSSPYTWGSGGTNDTEWDYGKWA